MSSFLSHTCVPVALITLIPHSVLFLWFTAVHCNGSFQSFAERISQDGIGIIYSNLNFASMFSVKVIVGFIAFQILLMKMLPGKTATGPETTKGNIPVYKDNGFLCYIVTMICFFALTFYLKSIGRTPTVIYDNFGDILVSMILFSLVFCLILYVKGRVSPSSSDNGCSSNFIFDYYWGVELYPRIAGIDVKVFTNCRFGLTAWALLVCIFALKSFELHGFIDGVFVTSVLQLLYLTKFFWWEAGYYRSMDIIVDRAGFYICWGCLCFVPGFYALVSLFMVQRTEKLGPQWTAILLFAGLLSLVVNYWADAQRQIVRSTDGKSLVWGKKAKIIHARYKLDTGEERQAVLLASGFWGLSRHFHYVPELTLTLCWSAVCGQGVFLMPYLYLIFLSVLLFHRSYRDDLKCRKKYGKYWDTYCKQVPYKIVPLIY